MSRYLFKRKTFTPFFLTQFLGAFNDNVFKNALIIMITYQTVQGSAFLVNLSALLFILPFFLFSAIGGQIGDKFEKSKLIQQIKMLEIIIMCMGAVFFIMDWIYPLMCILFLMGTQSALFGPVKYSILPQHLRKTELLKGNALVETGTFIAILVGTIYAGLAIHAGSVAKYIIAVSVIIIAVLGYISSRFIPKANANQPNLKINYNIVKESVKIIKNLNKSKKSVKNSVLGISWFWFIGTIFITQFPLYSKDFLHGNETIVIMMLTVFSVSIGLGAMLSEWLTDREIELGLVPIGAMGMTIGGIALYFSTGMLPDFIDGNTLRTAREFLELNGSWAVFGSVFIIGVSGGIYTVPLYTLLQLRTENKERSRIIAVNNIINSLFMVIAAIYAMSVLNFLNIIELLLSVSILNIFVSIYIFTVVPEFTMRFIVFILLKFMYRIKKKNLNIPMEGGLIVVGNHIGYMDSLILSAAISRPMRFVMYYKFYNLPILHFIFKNSGAIPIAGRNENRKIFEEAFDEIEKSLNNGEAIFIFPEGCLTRNGELSPFKSGIEHMIKRTPVPVYTVAMQGLWGSFFSKKKGRIPFKRFYSKVTVIGGEKVKPEDVTKEKLEKIVKDLIDNKV